VLVKLVPPPEKKKGLWTPKEMLKSTIGKVLEATYECRQAVSANWHKGDYVHWLAYSGSCIDEAEGLYVLRPSEIVAWEAEHIFDAAVAEGAETDEEAVAIPVDLTSDNIGALEIKRTQEALGGAQEGADDGKPSGLVDSDGSPLG